jgi:signal transduction histidine kinase
MKVKRGNILESPEILVPKLGDLLVREDLLTPEELQHALTKQAEFAAEGHMMLLGQLLVKLYLIPQNTLDGVITRQIFQLQAALERSNQELETRVEERTVELKNALCKLNQLDQLKANFMSSVSHELRMPMQLILGYLDLLDSGSLGHLTGEQSKAVGTMMDSCQRLRQLIEDLLSFSQLDSGSLPIDLVPTALDSHVRAAVDQALPAARTKGVIIGAKLVSDIPPVRADGERIRWVIDQLLDNALKFTPAGGKVLIRTTPKQEHATVAIRDSGVGIHQERIHEIFEPFHQLDGSVTRDYGGTGLGLALVQSILAAHGSKMTVNSRVGKGSCFAFSLPYSAVPPTLHYN